MDSCSVLILILVHCGMWCDGWSSVVMGWRSPSWGRTTVLTSPEAWGLDWVTRSWTHSLPFLFCCKTWSGTGRWRGKLLPALSAPMLTVARVYRNWALSRKLSKMVPSALTLWWEGSQHPSSPEPPRGSIPCRTAARSPLEEVGRWQRWPSSNVFPQNGS